MKNAGKNFKITSIKIDLNTVEKIDYIIENIERFHYLSHNQTINILLEMALKMVKRENKNEQN